MNTKCFGVRLHFMGECHIIKYSESRRCPPVFRFKWAMFRQELCDFFVGKSDEHRRVTLNWQIISWAAPLARHSLQIDFLAQQTQANQKTDTANVNRRRQRHGESYRDHWIHTLAEYWMEFGCVHLLNSCFCHTSMLMPCSDPLIPLFIRIHKRNAIN